MNSSEKNRQMTCNNCGGQMFQSGLSSYMTFCPRCGMRHDWESVGREVEQIKKKSSKKK